MNRLQTETEDAGTGTPVDEPISAEEGTVFRLLVEGMPLAVFACWEGRIQYANPAGDALLGAREIEDVIDHDFLRFVHTRDAETVRQLLRKPQCGSIWKPVRILQCNGNEVLADVTASDLGEGCVELVVRKSPRRPLRTFSVERTGALVGTDR